MYRKVPTLGAHWASTLGAGSEDFRTAKRFKLYCRIAIKSHECESYFQGFLLSRLQFFMHVILMALAVGPYLLDHDI